MVFEINILFKKKNIILKSVHISYSPYDIFCKTINAKNNIYKACKN